MRRSERALLRDYVWERSGGRCEWPDCGKPMVELAHIKSVGAGGSRSRDTRGNVFAACRLHARVSDHQMSAEVCEREIALLPYPLEIGGWPMAARMKEGLWILVEQIRIERNEEIDVDEQRRLDGRPF